MPAKFTASSFSGVAIADRFGFTTGDVLHIIAYHQKEEDFGHTKWLKL
jgi:hypothetical protein